MIKDCNGNEFRVGCVFGNRYNKDEREVVKIFNDYLLYVNTKNGISATNDVGFLAESATILHYKELAPDKNGKMLNQYDRVVVDTGQEAIVEAVLGGYILSSFENRPNTFNYSMPYQVAFVSRPTDVPTEAAKLKAEIQGQIKKLEADVAELKRKADGE